MERQLEVISSGSWTWHRTRSIRVSVKKIP